MKKPYCNLELSIVTLASQDVITTSGDLDWRDVTGKDVYFY